VATTGPAQGWSEGALGAARTLSVITLVGAVLGLVVGGVLGRVAMFVLARLNPSTAGLESDDGFEIGQFTLSGSLNLLLFGAVLGVAGAGIYAAIRSLIIGPRWFQVLSIAVGAAVVVGEAVVHTDGVDFIALKPPLLAIAIFVAIPGLYAGALTVASERFLASQGTGNNTILLVLGLLPWVPLFPLFLVLATGWALLQAAHRSDRTQALVANPAAMWIPRVLLIAFFLATLGGLAEDSLTLT